MSQNPQPRYPQWNTGIPSPVDDLSDEERAALGLPPSGFFNPNAPKKFGPDVPMSFAGGGGYGQESPATVAGDSPSSAAEIYKLMLSQAPYGSKERTLSRQQGFADELRKTKAPGMHGAGSRVQTAAHPLETLGALAQRGLGEWQSMENEKKTDELFKKRLRSLGASEEDIAGMSAT